MKFNKIKSLCKKKKAVYLFDRETDGGYIEQWIGDGNAFYPIIALPEMDKDSICAMWDISDKDREDYVFDCGVSLLDGISLENQCEGERPAYEGPFSIIAGDKVLIPIKTSRGIVFIDLRYLSPLVDIKKANTLELYECVTPSGFVYIAVKGGVILNGVIMPDQSLIAETYVKYMKSLSALWESAWAEKQRRKAEEAAGRPVQTVIDRETGEIIEEPAEQEAAEG